MLEFFLFFCFIDDVFVMFGGGVFQQIVDIPMGTNFAPLLANMFLYSYEAYVSMNTFHYIDDVLSLNVSKFMLCFLDHCLSVCPFFFVNVVTAILRFTTSDYTINIFKLLLFDKGVKGTNLSYMIKELREQTCLI